MSQQANLKEDKKEKVIFEHRTGYCRSSFDIRGCLLATKDGWCPKKCYKEFVLKKQWKKK